MTPDTPPKGYSVITVDCRELQPPEPLVKVLEALATREKNEVVKMLHRHSPKMLFPRLQERGLRYDLEEFEDGSIELLIWPEGR